MVVANVNCYSSCQVCQFDGCINITYILRIISTVSSSCHACAILNGISGVTVMAAPPLISSTWFPYLKFLMKTLTMFISIRKHLCFWNGEEKFKYPFSGSQRRRGPPPLPSTRCFRLQLQDHHQDFHQVIITESQWKYLCRRPMLLESEYPWSSLRHLSTTRQQRTQQIRPNNSSLCIIWNQHQHRTQLKHLRM